MDFFKSKAKKKKIPLILRGNASYLIFEWEAKKKLNVGPAYNPKVSTLKSTKENEQEKHHESLDSLFGSTETMEWWRITRLTWPGSCHPISSLSLPISSHRCAGCPGCSWAKQNMDSVFMLFFFLPLESGWSATRAAGASACPQLSDNKKKYWGERTCGLPLWISVSTYALNWKNKKREMSEHSQYYRNKVKYFQSSYL